MRFSKETGPSEGSHFEIGIYQRAPNPPEFAQLRGGTNLGVFVPIWLDLCRFAPTQTGLRKFGWVWSSLNLHCIALVIDVPFRPPGVKVAIGVFVLGTKTAEHQVDL